MKNWILVLSMITSNSYASDAVVAHRFQKVVVNAIVAARVSDSILEKDTSRAVIRIAVDLAVEGNVGFCKFQDFASSLDYQWYEAGHPSYLSVVTTACPTPKPLDLIETAYTDDSLPRTITTSFDVELDSGSSRTIIVMTGYNSQTEAKVMVSFYKGRVMVQLKP